MYCQPCRRHPLLLTLLLLLTFLTVSGLIFLIGYRWFEHKHKDYQEDTDLAHSATFRGFPEDISAIAGDLDCKVGVAEPVNGSRHQEVERVAVVDLATTDSDKVDELVRGVEVQNGLNTEGGIEKALSERVAKRGAMPLPIRESLADHHITSFDFGYSYPGRQSGRITGAVQRTKATTLMELRIRETRASEPATASAG